MLRPLLSLRSRGVRDRERAERGERGECDRDRETDRDPERLDLGEYGGRPLRPRESDRDRVLDLELDRGDRDLDRMLDAAEGSRDAIVCDWPRGQAVCCK